MTNKKLDWQDEDGAVSPERHRELLQELDTYFYHGSPKGVEALALDDTPKQRYKPEDIKDVFPIFGLTARPEDDGRIHMEMDFGPEEAMWFLRCQESNRELIPKTVDEYMNEILDFNWIVSGESIKMGIRSEGTVQSIDGQNRSAGVIKSNRTVRILVSVGFKNPDAVFDVLDTGRNRQDHDILHNMTQGLHGKDTKVIGNAMTLLSGFNWGTGSFTGGQLNGDQTRHKGDRRQHYKEQYSDYPNLVVNYWKMIDYVKAANDGGETTWTSWIPTSVATGLYTIMDTIDPEAAADFWDILDSGNIKELGYDHPVIALRRKGLKEKKKIGSKHILRRSDVVCWVIKGWNDYQANKSIKNFVVPKKNLYTFKDASNQNRLKFKDN